jgi:hypothetical protein
VSFRDVMSYVQRQTRARFDLFSYGQREYLNVQNPSLASGPASVPAPVTQPSYRRVVRTSFSSMPNTVGQVNSTLPTQLDRINDVSLASTLTQMLGRPTGNAIPLGPQIQVQLDAFDADDEEENDEDLPQANAYIANALLSLLNLPGAQLTAPRGVGRAPMDTFLQPVAVYPTTEQIARNTTLGHLVSDTDHACAICQDSLTEEQEGRKLNQCGHWFHKQCIDTWFERDVHCPVCRHDIREPMRQRLNTEEMTQANLEADLH